MLPKKYRLPLRTKLPCLRKEGKIFHSPLFGLLVSRQLANSRFSFIVSKKIHQRAVRRNRIKRLLREAVRGFLPQVKPGFDAVFLAKKKILHQELPAIQTEIQAVFKKAGLL